MPCYGPWAGHGMAINNSVIHCGSNIHRMPCVRACVRASIVTILLLLDSRRGCMFGGHFVAFLSLFMKVTRTARYDNGSKVETHCRQTVQDATFPFSVKSSASYHLGGSQRTSIQPCVSLPRYFEKSLGYVFFMPKFLGLLVE